ncbi:hypothetical protein P171DRAFT_516750 [Karstenula rhodostoma CBS 690.94]|uniref:F-box domain-containing protein n=1 Tax=Karstenula rhodostoma CBS 690.94 TaxID=1392251 RepID=A0A9P4UIA3_9PLEO|nr:hypothetical protein P171DRAFT_516750 [Karstenula rhodostoma CBS 690.94]
MKTRSNERSTRSSDRRTPTRPTRKKASGVTKPPSQPTPARKRTTKRKGLPHALEEYHKQSSTDPNASSPRPKLTSLPLELFTHITTCLPPEALVCLSLTCKLALQYIGAECWRHPEIRKHQYHCRRHLMQCLIRDNPPDLTFCNFCNTLHPPLKPPRTHRVTKLTKICMSQWAVVDYFPQVRDEQQEGSYSLLHAHIHDVFNRRDGDPDPKAADLLAGNYSTAQHPDFTYALASSARWIDNRLVLRHTHVFRAKPRGPLNLAAVLALPLRLCAHMSTTTEKADRARYVGTHTANTPLLTHAIASAFAPGRQSGGAPSYLDNTTLFRKVTPLEQKQIDSADAGEDVVWKCRGCPTKFKVAVGDDGGALEIVTWHCFGADLLHADKYWEWFVRREVANLGAGKRNSEYWFPTGRSVPDFKTAEG